MTFKILEMQYFDSFTTICTINMKEHLRKSKKKKIAEKCKVRRVIFLFNIRKKVGGRGTFLQKSANQFYSKQKPIQFYDNVAPQNGVLKYD